MKKTYLVHLFFCVAIISTLSTLTSCKRVYVVKPEDIQAYLDKGADLTITLPDSSTFDLINVHKQRLIPGNETLEPPVPQPATRDTAANGANGEKKFRHAAAFVQKAYAAEGAYRCPTVCQIIIKTPQ